MVKAAYLTIVGAVVGDLAGDGPVGWAVALSAALASPGWTGLRTTVSPTLVWQCSAISVTTRGIVHRVFRFFAFSWKLFLQVLDGLAHIACVVHVLFRVVGEARVRFSPLPVAG